MQPDEMMIFVTLVTATLLVLLMLTSVYKKRLDFKARKLEAEAQARAAAVPAPSARDDRTELLEDRVRVLERIATDRAPDIARQIEALRDREHTP
jgi:hypothetical protein